MFIFNIQMLILTAMPPAGDTKNALTKRH